MKRKSVLSIVVVLVMLFSIRASAVTDSIYAHISYIDGEAFVIRSAEDKPVNALVNLPLLSGDTIFTGDKGRCEIQFGNGTLIRLDKKTRLKVGTVLSKGLTGEKKITTLKLDSGHIFSMSQVYKGEIFQVVTETAAVKMINRSTNSIRVNETEGTHVYVNRGEVGVLYGNLEKSPKKIFVKSGKGFWITPAAGTKQDNSKANKEFYLWNEMVNKNFKELHYGISKVPEVIYRRSPGIVHFAERFSTKYGTWVYNDIFGYVWQPAVEIFKERRPFFDANFVKINDELVLVPNRPWGWAPAHLGTWFFSKTDGWVWIPGDVFSKGICTIGLKKLTDAGFSDILYRSPTGPYLNILNYWIDWIYGDVGLYGIYRTQGNRAWQTAYEAKFHKKPVPLKNALELAPEQVKHTITKIEKTSFDKIALDFKHIVKSSGLADAKMKILREITPGKDGVGKRSIIRMSRDWNPDARWARRTGVKIFYSSGGDTIICPELKLSSKEMTLQQRTMLKKSVNKESLIKKLSYGKSTGAVARPNSSVNSSRETGMKAGNGGKAAGAVSTPGKGKKK